MLGNSAAAAAAVVLVVRTRPLAIPRATIIMRKSTHGFPFPSYMSMELRYKRILDFTNLKSLKNRCARVNSCKFTKDNSIRAILLKRKVQ